MDALLLFQSDPSSHISSNSLQSYNHFLHTELPNILKKNNPIQLQRKQKTEKKTVIHVYLGGRQNPTIQYKSPTIVINGEQIKLFPNEARLRNITYSAAIYYDIDIDIVSDVLDDEEVAIDQTIAFQKYT